MCLGESGELGYCRSFVIYFKKYIELLNNIYLYNMTRLGFAVTALLGAVSALPAADLVTSLW